MDMNKFFGKKEKYDVRGEEIILEPFKGKELGLLMSLDKTEDANALINVVFEALSKHNAVTREQVENMELGSLTEFVGLIMKVNGIEEENDGTRPQKSPKTV